MGYLLWNSTKCFLEILLKMKCHFTPKITLKVHHKVSVHYFVPITPLTIAIKKAP